MVVIRHTKDAYSIKCKNRFYLKENWFKENWVKVTLLKTLLKKSAYFAGSPMSLGIRKQNALHNRTLLSLFYLWHPHLSSRIWDIPLAVPNKLPGILFWRLNAHPFFQYAQVNESEQLLLPRLYLALTLGSLCLGCMDLPLTLGSLCLECLRSSSSPTVGPRIFRSAANSFSSSFIVSIQISLPYIKIDMIIDL